MGITRMLHMHRQGRVCLIQRWERLTFGMEPYVQFPLDSLSACPACMPAAHSGQRPLHLPSMPMCGMNCVICK